jgi:hypothetical protein
MVDKLGRTAIAGIKQVSERRDQALISDYPGPAKPKVAQLHGASPQQQIFHSTIWDRLWKFIYE